MTKQNFYQGQRVGPEEMNGITAYGDASQGYLVASTLGLGLVHGYGAEAVSGFVAGIDSGLAYNAQGRPLVLASGVQVNLASHTPAVGNKTILLGLVPAIISDSPATDSMGNTVYRLHTESVEFVHGVSLPENALPLYEVNLSPVGIIGFRLVAPLLETPLAQSQRTKGYGYNGGSPRITAPNGFEVDLLTLATRRAVFDALKPGGYAKGDILWLEPAGYDTRSTPPKLPTAGGVAYPYTVPAAEAFMGKARTYSEPTDYRQYAVRLRALKDNPRDPAIVEAIGSDWAVDDPSAIVEEGSSSNGSYVMYAGGKRRVFMEFKHSNMAVNTGQDVAKKIPIDIDNVIIESVSYFINTTNDIIHYGSLDAIIESSLMYPPEYTGIINIRHRSRISQSNLLNGTGFGILTNQY